MLSSHLRLHLRKAFFPVDIFLFDATGRLFQQQTTLAEDLLLRAKGLRGKQFYTVSV